jgi:hypothetical protein
MKIRIIKENPPENPPSGVEPASVEPASNVSPFRPPKRSWEDELARFGVEPERPKPKRRESDKKK